MTRGDQLPRLGNEDVEVVEKIERKHRHDQRRNEGADRGNRSTEEPFHSRSRGGVTLGEDRLNVDVELLEGLAD